MIVTREKIRDYADQVAEMFHPERILLFGSYARGDFGPNSDVDLLVVMPDGGDPLGKSIEIVRALPHYGFSLDLIVRDPEVLKWRIANEDWFLREAVQQGIVLYEAKHQRVGS